MWFFEVAILEITIRFFKFVWEILPIQPTIQPRGKNQHPLGFSWRWEHFSKTASMVRCGIATGTVPWSPIFEKRYHLREKGGAYAFENNHSFINKGTVDSCILAHIITQKRCSSWWSLRHDPARTAPWPLGWVKTSTKIIRSHAYSTTWLGEKKFRLFIYRDFSTNGCLGKH